VVRAFVEHSLFRQIAAGYPERYFYMGPMFRHERPQKGRQRQFHQIGVELLGSAEPAGDAETIEMADTFLAELGVDRREILLNSVGDEVCRPRYRERLQAWLEPRLPRLCDDCNRRYRENPMRVFDCKVEQDRALLERAPTLDASLCEPCRTHFDRVTRALDSLGVAYKIEPRIVRGLDYYQRTVFEITSPDLGAQNAVLGGGRYDGLIEELGGPALPAFGFAIGLERLIAIVPGDRVPGHDPDVALVSLGGAGWSAAMGIARQLRAAGVACFFPLVERPLGAQLRRADRSGARFALFVGSEELETGRFGLKDLRTGQQVDVGLDQVAERVKESRA
jgi:histidyl-tRNA synthetase